MLKLSLLTAATRSACRKGVLGLGLLFALAGAFSAGPASAADFEIEKRIPIQHGWSGYWWPTLVSKGFHLYDKVGKFTPLVKYYQATGDANPFNWELRNKYSTDPSTGWWGHCDGWAAASIMMPEPKQGVRVNNRVNFNVGEVKGLATALWTSCTSDFFAGARHDSGANYNTDLRALDFHKAIVHYLYEREEGIVANITPKPEVWNYPVFAFKMKGVSDDRYPDWTYVTTTIWYAEDNVAPDYIGNPDPIYRTMTMTYWVKGTPSSPDAAKWTERSVYEHPQFIWHPATPGQPGSQRNPIDQRSVEQIVQFSSGIDAEHSGPDSGEPDSGEPGSGEPDTDGPGGPGGPGDEPPGA